MHKNFPSRLLLLPSSFPYFRSSKSCSSSITATPISLALSNFEPGSSPPDEVRPSSCLRAARFPACRFHQFFGLGPGQGNSPGEDHRLPLRVPERLAGGAKETGTARILGGPASDVLALVKNPRASDTSGPIPGTCWSSSVLALARESMS